MNSDIDKQKMFKIIEEFPSQFKVGFNSAKGVGDDLKKGYSNIIIAGMGGSALAGELLLLFKKELKLDVPIYLDKNYDLPAEAGENSLVITISYSGNTEETLSAYNEAIMLGYDVLSICSGGELKELSKKNKTRVALLPKGYPPRLTTGFQFFALIGLLKNIELIEFDENIIKKLEKSVSPKEAKSLAESIVDDVGDKTPLFYSSKKNKALAYILKIQINENAKRHAFYNFFPELNHNEMAGYEHSDPNAFYPIIIQADNDHPRIKKRMELFSQIIKKKGYKTFTLDLNNKNIYNRVLDTILFGTWLSYLIALENKIDPSPVDILEDFKKKME